MIIIGEEKTVLAPNLSFYLHVAWPPNYARFKQSLRAVSSCCRFGISGRAQIEFSCSFLRLRPLCRKVSFSDFFFFLLQGVFSDLNPISFNSLFTLNIPLIFGIFPQTHSFFSSSFFWVDIQCPCMA